MKIKEIKLNFELNETCNNSMNQIFFNFLKKEKKYSIESNSDLTKNNILEKLANSSFHFKIEKISYIKDNDEIRDLEIKLKEV